MNGAEWAACPRQDYVPQLRRYYEQGVPLGGFLTAILENDFVQACARADAENSRLLFLWAAWLYLHMDDRARGSEAKVKTWLEHGGLEGRAAWVLAQREPAEDDAAG